MMSGTDKILKLLNWLILVDSYAFQRLFHFLPIDIHLKNPFLIGS